MNSSPSHTLKPVEIGEVMEGEVIGEVVESKSKFLKVGDMVNAKIGWQEFSTVDEALGYKDYFRIKAYL